MTTPSEKSARTPITDRHLTGYYGGKDMVPIETARALEEIAEELFVRLNNARDDVAGAISTHLAQYGENYRATRLQAMREELAAVDAALAKYQAMKEGAK